MKWGKSVVLSLLLLIAGMGGIIQAADEGVSPMGKMMGVIKSNHFDKDLGYSLGLKLWVNEWDMPVEIGGVGNTSHILQFESDDEVTYIPSFLVRYHNFFMGGSYLPETDYNFSSQHNKSNLWEPSGEREEWDLNIGYFITPNVALSLGYKDMDRELKIIVDNSTPCDYPLSVDGPILGISSSVPVGDRFGLYGNFAYGWMSGDGSYLMTGFEPIKFDMDGTYTFCELGFTYSIPLKRVVSVITTNVGYRFQRMDMEADGKGAAAEWFGTAGDQHDSTAGFVFGVSASF